MVYVFPKQLEMLRELAGKADARVIRIRLHKKHNQALKYYQVVKKNNVDIALSPVMVLVEGFKKNDRI